MHLWTNKLNHAAPSPDALSCLLSSLLIVSTSAKFPQLRRASRNAFYANIKTCVCCARRLIVTHSVCVPLHIFIASKRTHSEWKWILPKINGRNSRSSGGIMASAHNIPVRHSARSPAGCVSIWCQIRWGYASHYTMYMCRQIHRCYILVSKSCTHIPYNRLTDETPMQTPYFANVIHFEFRTALLLYIYIYIYIAGIRILMLAIWLADPILPGMNLAARCLCHAQCMCLLALVLGCQGTRSDDLQHSR